MSIHIKISKKKVPYSKAIKTLERRVVDVEKGKKRELLWILEHPLTYTAGIRSDKSDIIDKNIKIIESKRGGKITVHNPGQLIVYFVINLNKRKKDIRHLVGIIEKSIIEFLSYYNISAKNDKKNIGIWVKDKKIAAIGIRVKKWIAFHGCSINFKNNINDYKKINPCGLDNEKITSVEIIKRKKIKLNITKLKNIFKNNLSTI